MGAGRVYRATCTWGQCKQGKRQGQWGSSLASFLMKCGQGGKKLKQCDPVIRGGFHGLLSRGYSLIV
jgi:hypothetical protein